MARSEVLSKRVEEHYLIRAIGRRFDIIQRREKQAEEIGKIANREIREKALEALNDSIREHKRHSQLILSELGIEKEDLKGA